MTALPEEEARLRKQSAQLDEDLRQLRANAEWQAAQPARRERIAAEAVKGLLASGLFSEGLVYSELAQASIRIADALIEELDKPKEVKP